MYIYFVNGKANSSIRIKLYFISFATVHWIDVSMMEEMKGGLTNVL